MQNESTPDARGPVFCGVDTHADSHWLYVLDWRGRKVLSRQFPADAAGYEALAGAIAAAGEPACVAMEGTSSYGAGLTRHLASLGMPVREALSPARTQRRRPGQGKCDEADAERAARAAMSGSKLGTPKSQDGWVDGVRCMLAARSGAVKARTSAINTARSLLTTAPEGLRSRFRGMAGPRLMEELPSVRAEGALGAALGALADLWAAARDAALDMERAIEASLEENCPALLAMYGCGPVSAAKLAVAAGDNPGRLRSEASFAAICGACPIPASSGKTVRHRLNRGGDRQANSALHEIARQRVMRDPETAEYADGLATLMWTVPGGAQETGGPYMRDPRHPRHFTDEFKRQIVDLYNAGKPKREIMDEYDLGKSTVERWIKSINATGSPRAACNRTPEQNRILELERENRRLRMEVDVLKQAALIYARK